MTGSAYPLNWPEGWPRTPQCDRKSNSPFQTTFEQARRDLIDELWLLKARDIVISSCLPLRQDGQLRVDAERQPIHDPGVAVYFNYQGHALAAAQDLYANVQDNLRAITLAIGQLRGVARHGGPVMMARALGGLSAHASPIEWRQEPAWCAILGIPHTSEKWMIEAAYKQRAKECHPDLGGSDAMMTELNTARDEALKERS